MTNRRNIGWLLGELPGLVGDGTLTPEAADRLRNRYGAEAGEARSWTVNLFAVLGAALVGGGMILLFAHNWDQLSRAARTVVSLAPLIVAQALAAWVLATGKKSVAWREGSGLFWAASIGAAIALIGQTYHLPADLERFLLTWAILLLPVVYLLRSSLAALICLGCALWRSGADPPSEIWILILLVAPHLAVLVRDRRLGGGRATAWETVVAWSLAIAATVATVQTLIEHPPFEVSGIVTLSGLFVALYLAGRDEAGWRRAFRRAGALGAVGFAWLLTFGGIWDGLTSDWSVSTMGWSFDWLRLAVSALLPAVALVLLWLRFSEADLAERFIGASLLVVTAAWLMTLWLNLSGPAVALLNSYLFVLGMVLTLRGVQKHDRLRANWGMALLSALIMARFFDSDLSFVVRGLLFMVIGIGFLALNFQLSRRRPA